jgi:hypothetical protein
VSAAGEALTVVQTLAAAAAVWVASRGLRTWQQQLHGTVEYEHARRLYRAVLEVREEMTNVRNPFIPIGETNAAFVEAGVEPSHERGIDERASALVYNRRWIGLQKARVTLSAELLEAEALWGESIREPAKKLNSCVGELYTATMWHVREKSRPQFNSRKPDDSAIELSQRMHDVLYSSGSDEGDAFFAKVIEAVRDFEGLLKPHLRSRST